MRTPRPFWGLMLACGLQYQYLAGMDARAESQASIVELAKSTRLQKRSTRKYSNDSLPELRGARVSFTTRWNPPPGPGSPKVEILKVENLKTRDSGKLRKSGDGPEREPSERTKERKPPRKKGGSSRPIRLGRSAQPKPDLLLWQQPK